MALRGKRVLFLLKHGEQYSAGNRPKGGLFNSARMVAEMLEDSNTLTWLEHCIDGNDIDRLVTLIKPDVCIIEALWVTPEKLQENVRLHPATRFVVRLHSELPFLAQEGIALQWLKAYGPDVEIAVNSARMDRDLGYALGVDSIYLPNYYPAPSRLPDRSGRKPSKALRVGCFGAMRPLKNHLTQAVAAIEFAAQEGKQLLFCVNSTNADPQILKNMRALFAGRDEAELYEIPWYGHDAFRYELALCAVALQCSLSETFNIVSADAVSMGVPLVVSPEVSWASRWSKVDPANVDAIVVGMRRALKWPILRKWNLNRLRKFSEGARRTWLEADL